jgi:hypothetical protein
MFRRPAGAKPPEERILKMEMKPVESGETTEKSESAEQTAARRLDDATFEPQALVEQTGEYRQAESIQADFVALVDTTVRQAAAESDPVPASDRRPPAAVHAASGGISAESAATEADPINAEPGENSMAATALSKPGSAVGDGPGSEPVDEEIGPKPKKYYKEVGGWDAFGVHIPGTMTEFTNEYADLQKPGSTAGDDPGSEPVDEEIRPKPKKYYKEVGGWDAFGVHIPGTMTEFTNEYADLQKPGSAAGDDPGSEPVDEEIGPKPKKYYKEVGGWDAFGVHIPGTMTEFTNEYADLQKPGGTAGTGAGNLSVEKQIGEHKNEPADPKKTGNTVSNNPESGLVDEQIGPKEQPKKKQPYSYTKKDPEQSVLGVTWGGEEHTYYNTFADIENPAKQSTQGQTGKPVDGKPEKGQEEDESD